MRLHFYYAGFSITVKSTPTYAELVTPIVDLIAPPLSFQKTSTKIYENYAHPNEKNT